MAAKTKLSTEVVMDHETWIEMLYQLFNDNEIKKLASIIQPKIQGFTAKNIVKAPLAMLRKKTIEQLKQNKNIVNWMTKWFDPGVSQIKESNLDFEQFCHKSKFGEGITPAESIALIGILYPDMFNVHKECLQQNIKAGKHPLDDLGIKKLTPKKELQVKALSWEDSMVADSCRMLIEKTMKSPPVLEGSVKEWIQQKQAVEIGEIAYVALNRMDEILKWPEGEKAIFMQMAFHDSQKFLWKVMEDIVKEKNDLDKEDKAKERRIKKLEKQSAERADSEAALKAQAAEAERMQLVNEQQYTKTLDAMRAENHMLKQRLAVEKEAAAALAVEVPLLVMESDFMLLTRYSSHDFAGMIPAQQIYTVEQIDSLYDLQLASEIRYLFIHSDGFSTKEQFELDEHAAAFQLPFKSVSGDCSAVTRQLIYYLEGALIDEINS